MTVRPNAGVQGSWCAETSANSQWLGHAGKEISQKREYAPKDPACDSPASGDRIQSISRDLVVHFA